MVLQYLSIRHADVLRSGEPQSAGTIGDGHAMAETINGLFKRSFIETVHEKVWNPLNARPSTGLAGSTTEGSL
jgi:hypothetical protein